MNFPPNSRYFTTETATLTSADGRTIVYLKRRFIGQPDNFALLEEHTVSQGERLDHVASQKLGDPEQFWRICDANAALRPQELTEEIGRSIRITLPEGIPGAPDGQ